MVVVGDAASRRSSTAMSRPLGEGVERVGERFPVGESRVASARMGRAPCGSAAAPRRRIGAAPVRGCDAARDACARASRRGSRRRRRGRSDIGHHARAEERGRERDVARLRACAQCRGLLEAPRRPVGGIATGDAVGGCATATPRERVVVTDAAASAVEERRRRSGRSRCRARRFGRSRRRRSTRRVRRCGRAPR